MSTTGIKIFSVFLSILFLFTGCQSKTDQIEKVSMGRYAEKEVSLPKEKIAQPLTFYTDTRGMLSLLCYTYKEGTHSGSIYLRLYEYDPALDAWADHSPAWMDKFNAEDTHLGINVAALDDKGGIYLYGVDYTDSENREEFFSYISADGTENKLEFQAPTDPSGSGIRSMQVTESGDLLIDTFFTLFLIDAKTGEEKRQIYSSDDGMIESYFAYGSQAVISEKDHLLLFDLQTGQQTDTVSIGLTGNFLDSNTAIRPFCIGENGSFYFADKNGIFNWATGSAVIERSVNGTLTTLNSPAFYSTNLVVSNGNFFVLGYLDESIRLFSYEFDPNIPTLPDTELRIYALNDNPTIRQAMTVFQQEYTDVHVTFEIGLTNPSITKEDAIRTLATQLLSENGPDILILDSLPNEYLKKGIFMDLSDVVSPMISDGTLLKNQTNSFLEKDQSLYAVPARFAVPMMQGETSLIDTVHSLSDFAEWSERNQGSYWRPASEKSARNLMNVFYPVCFSSFIKEDGTIEKEALQTFLSSYKKIYDLTSNKVIEDSDTLGYKFGALGWISNEIALNANLLYSFTDTYAPWQAIENQKDIREGKEASLFHQNIFLPKTILAINSQTEQEEIAKKFLTTVLSEPVLKYEFGDGMSVNRKALEQFTAPQDESVRFSTYGYSAFNHKGEETYVPLTIYYPPENHRKETLSFLTSLDTPIYYDETTYQFILEESIPYLLESKNLEETVSSILEKQKLYLSQ